jgi:hypothetical protein
MSAAPKVYVPGIDIKRVSFTNGGHKLRVGVNVAKLVAFLNEHVNDKGFVNLEILERRETSQYGETHYAALDTWKPKDKPATPQSPPPGQAPVKDNPDGLPF